MTLVSTVRKIVVIAAVVVVVMVWVIAIAVSFGFVDLTPVLRRIMG